MKYSKQILLLTIFISASNAWSDDSGKVSVQKDKDGAKVRVEAGAVANTNAESGKSSLGGQVGASLEIPKVPTSDGGTMPLKLSGSIGRVGSQTIGTVAVDVGKADPREESGPSVAAHVGINASGQITRIDMMPGINFANGKSSTTLSARFPLLGGAIIDRQTGAGMLATGLKLETMIPLSERLQLGGGVEADVLLGGVVQKTDSGAVPEGGVYINPSLAAIYKIGERLYIKAEAIGESLKYKATSTASDGSKVECNNATLGLTGVVSAHAAF